MESKTFNSLEDFQNQFDNIGKEEQVQVYFTVNNFKLFVFFRDLLIHNENHLQSFVLLFLIDGVKLK